MTSQQRIQKWAGFSWSEVSGCGFDVGVVTCIAVLAGHEGDGYGDDEDSD